MRNPRFLAFGLALLLGAIASHPADANARRGPYPRTALSRNGELIWYTGLIDLTGHRWRELDQLCQSVPIAQVHGWRAPTEAEVRSLFVELYQNNGLARWTELYPDGQTLEPAVPAFDPSARQHGQINILFRDLLTYEGQRTTLAQAAPDRMYIIRWFNRWTLATLNLKQTIRYHPGDYLLGPNERLLCVADHRDNASGH